jgi:nucleoid-associated protein YgaU
MPFTKARIQILDKEAVDPKRGLREFIDVEFNPTEYSLAKSAQIAEIGIPGLDSPVLQFIRGQNEKLTLELFFDTTASGLGETGVTDVRSLTQSIYQLVKIQPKTHAPPRIMFVWGSLSFKAIVESVTQKFTLFNPTGIPLRATLSVSFREYKTLPDQLAELNLQSPDHTKRRVVRQHDTLNRIATEEYKDPHQWRLIALNNAQVLSSFRRLVPGTVLIVPPIELSGKSPRTS